MKILTINSGSSSIKCQYFIDQTSVATLLIEKISKDRLSHIEISYDHKSISYDTPLQDHHQALDEVFAILIKYDIVPSIEMLDAIGHRVVHGGSLFQAPTLVSDAVIEAIESLIPLAPLHNPANLDGIKSIRSLYPHLPQVAIFDTAFHQTMPAHAYHYAIPHKYYLESDIRRYGFHGTSHAFVAKQASKLLNKSLNQLNLITLHLGNGASATAIKDGQSIDTSMGMTPLEGLMMGTRSGDIDPAIINYISQTHNKSIKEIDTILNKESGLLGICGTNDMREVISQAENSDEMSQLALDMYCYSIKKYIGAYIAVLGRVDAIIFTGGIGEHASKVREMVCDGFEYSFGIELEREANLKKSNSPRTISTPSSRIRIYVIPTNEELEIALQSERVLTR